MSQVGIALTGAIIAHLVFVTAFLLARPEPRKDHSYAIALFFAAVMINGTGGLFELFPELEPLARFSPLMGSTLMLTGPALYYYALALTSPERLRLQWSDAPHLIPFGLALASATALAIAQGVFHELPHIGGLQALSDQLQTTLYVMLMSIYIVLMAKQMLRHRARRLDYFSNLEGRSLRWFEWMIGLLVVAWALNFLLIVIELFTRLPALPADYGAAVFALWLFPLSFMALWQQPIYTNSAATEPRRGHELILAVPQLAPPLIGQEQSQPAKYSRSALDDERSQRIAAKIEQAMATHRLYRNQQLNLRNLSDHVKVTENYLSQALNEYLGRSFYEYVNHWRIREACSLLSSTSMSVIDIGEEVGFNSRSTFNAAFRKEMAMTPSEFRSARLAEPDTSGQRLA